MRIETTITPGYGSPGINEEKWKAKHPLWSSRFPIPGSANDPLANQGASYARLGEFQSLRSTEDLSEEALRRLIINRLLA